MFYHTIKPFIPACLLVSVMGLGRGEKGTVTFAAFSLQSVISTTLHTILHGSTCIDITLYPARKSHDIAQTMYIRDGLHSQNNWHDKDFRITAKTRFMLDKAITRYH